jgi:hypothetical protein
MGTGLRNVVDVSEMKIPLEQNMCGGRDIIKIARGDVVWICLA